MPILLSGSIAMDHLMRYPGKFSDALLADQLHKVSLSFLVDDLVLRRGGVSANIAFGMTQLGHAPVLVGAVGEDFGDYRAWLERHGVDCESVHVSQEQHTARFTCTTDLEMNQIASFYPGAMSEGRNIELAPVVHRTGAELIVISADDPEAMVRHTQECRELGFAFAADPSQQISNLDAEQLRTLIDGAQLLFTNEYERELLQSKTGIDDAGLAAKVGVRITTLGADGVEIAGAEMGTLRVGVAKVGEKEDPTGVGDAFRAGFLSARSWGLGWERSAQVGNLLAGYVLETVGTQEYTVDSATFLSRLADSYSSSASDEVAPFLR